MELPGREEGRQAKVGRGRQGRQAGRQGSQSVWSSQLLRETIVLAGAVQGETRVQWGVGGGGQVPSGRLARTLMRVSVKQTTTLPPLWPCGPMALEPCGPCAPSCAAKRNEGAGNMSAVFCAV